MRRTIAFRAPTRIDFGGGWTDVPPYCDREGGYVCNVAITRYATVRLSAMAQSDAAPSVITDRPSDRSLVEAALRRVSACGVELALHNDFPVGAGLGGSSAAGVATVAALAAWKGAQLAPTALAERSRELEIEDLGIAGGRQDHYAAVFGGALGLRFGTGAGVGVSHIELTEETRRSLERRCLLVYTGQSRISGDSITAVLDAYKAGEARVLFALRRMKALAEEMAAALASEDLDRLGALVGEHWKHQRALHPAIPTPLVDAIVDRARAAGACGAKALGASGGGCVLVITGADNSEAIAAALEPLGARLTFTVDDRGVTECR